MAIPASAMSAMPALRTNGPTEGVNVTELMMKELGWTQAQRKTQRVYNLQMRLGQALANAGSKSPAFLANEAAIRGVIQGYADKRRTVIAAVLALGDEQLQARLGDQKTVRVPLSAIRSVFVPATATKQDVIDAVSSSGIPLARGKQGALGAMFAVPLADFPASIRQQWQAETLVAPVAPSVAAVASKPKKTATA